MTDLNAVREFWEKNPLWTGESEFEPGTKSFFEEHRSVYITDCFAGRFDIRFLPPPGAKASRCAFSTWAAELVFG